jgi:hypothetical protein
LEHLTSAAAAAAQSYVCVLQWSTSELQEQLKPPLALEAACCLAWLLLLLLLLHQLLLLLPHQRCLPLHHLQSMRG